MDRGAWQATSIASQRVDTTERNVLSRSLLLNEHSLPQTPSLPQICLQHSCLLSSPPVVNLDLLLACPVSPLP